eukprot:gene7799-8610_t
MSDSCFYAVTKKQRALLDVIDDAWEKDYLSDDEIIVPKELEGDVDPLEEGEEESEDKESWNDLGMDRALPAESKGSTLHAIASQKTNSSTVLPHQIFPQS